MESLITFVVSLVVSILLVPFANQQRERTAVALESLIGDAHNARVAKQNPVVPTRLASDSILPPTQLRAILAQALDTAYNFPSLVLTLIAFLTVVPDGPWWPPLLLVAAIFLTLLLAWMGDPANLGRYLRLQTGKRGDGKVGVSFVTWGLLIANVAGCVLAVIKVVGET